MTILSNKKQQQAGQQPAQPLANVESEQSSNTPNGTQTNNLSNSDSRSSPETTIILLSEKPSSPSTSTTSSNLSIPLESTSTALVNAVKTNSNDTPVTNESKTKIKIKSSKKSNKRKIKSTNSSIQSNNSTNSSIASSSAGSGDFINLSQTNSIQLAPLSFLKTDRIFALDEDQNEYYRLSDEDEENVIMEAKHQVSTSKKTCSSGTNSSLPQVVVDSITKTTKVTSGQSNKSGKKKQANTAANELNNNSNNNNNSEDEYEQTQTICLGSDDAFIKSAKTLEELEENFCRALKEKKGFIIKPMKEDGACLFRAVADQIYGDEEMHSTIRCHCMDYIAKNADYFKQYMTEDVDRYITRKRQDSCFGNHIEIIAIAEIYNRPIEVYEYSTEPKNTFQSVFQTDYEPIRLSYHGRMHYNSVVNPYKATIGVGLGLPQFIPGLAEKNLLNEALKKSEEFHIEQAMLDDKLKATDWEATNDEMLELVARESYLQWLKDSEKRNSLNFLQTTTAACSSSSTSSSNWPKSSSNDQTNTSPSSSSKLSSSAQNSNNKTTPKSSSKISSSARNEFLGDYLDSGAMGLDLYDQSFGHHQTNSLNMDNDDENDLLAKVLAESQQEYLESLKLKHQQQKNNQNYF